MAIPSLAMIPSGYKDGKVYSVLPSNGDGDFTFSRGSNATRVNKDGLIETVTGDTPRLDYSDGSCPSLLLEPQSTNLVTYSEDFSQSGWVKVNNAIVSATKVISPDGTLNASQIIFDGTSQGRIEDAIPSLIQGVDYTVSVYARVASGTQMVEFGSVSGFEYTLTTEWQRLTSTEVENDTVGYPRLICNDAATIEIWGFQLEQQSYATSYIPTNGATATRLADVCNDAGTSDTFNDSEGVLMAEISALADDGTNKRISISNGTTSDNDRINLMYTLPSNEIVINYKASGTTRVSFTYVLSNSIDYNKVLMLYKSGDFRFYVNGFKLDTDNNTTMIADGTLSELAFEDATNSNPFYGKTKQVQYYNSALTDSEIEELTSWESFLEMAAGQNYTIK